MTATLISLPMRSPELQPWGSSLLDVAPVQNDPTAGVRFLGDKGQYLSAACMVPELGPFCGVPGSSKTLNSLSPSNSTSFSVHGLVSCKAVGMGDVLQPELERVWAAGLESWGVEQALRTNVFGTAATADITAAWGVTPTSIAQCVALLEGYASQHYNGKPIIHIPIPLISMAMTQLALGFNDDGVLETKYGSRVVAGRGYITTAGRSITPAGATAAAGDMWIYATGEVEIFSPEPVRVVPGFNSPAAGSNNELTVLAERSYGVTWDCLAVGLHFQAFS